MIGVSRTRRVVQRIAIGLLVLMAGMPTALAGFWDESRHMALPPEALASLRRVAIQHNGRTKPFDSFAWE